MGEASWAELLAGLQQSTEAHQAHVTQVEAQLRQPRAAYNVRGALDGLGGQRDQMAAILSQHDQQRQAILSDHTRTPEYKREQLAALRTQSHQALDALRTHREQVAGQVRASLASVTPRHERAELDSAWARVKPYLDTRAPEHIGGAMQHIAHDPAARAAIREYGPLYIRTRAKDQPERMVRTLTDMTMQQLNLHEDAHLSAPEKEAKAQRVELEHGMYNLNLAESITREGLSGQRVGALPGWTKQDTLTFGKR